MARQGVKIAKEISVRECLRAVLAFHFSAPHFFALASHSRNKKTGWQKDEGQKDRRHLWISSSSTLHLFFARLRVSLSMLHKIGT
jgi:hypothetical protein